MAIIPFKLGFCALDLENNLFFLEKLENFFKKIYIKVRIKQYMNQNLHLLYWSYTKVNKCLQVSSFWRFFLSNVNHFHILNSVSCFMLFSHKSKISREKKSWALNHKPFGNKTLKFCYSVISSTWLAIVNVKALVYWSCKWRSLLSDPASKSKKVDDLHRGWPKGSLLNSCHTEV